MKILTSRSTRCDVTGTITSPVRSELHLGALTGHQLRDEREVRDLSGCPAELEDDDEGREVEDLSPLRSVVGAGQARGEDEGERHQDANDSWKTDKEMFGNVVKSGWWCAVASFGTR